MKARGIGQSFGNEWQGCPVPAFKPAYRRSAAPIRSLLSPLFDSSLETGTAIKVQLVVHVTSQRFLVLPTAGTRAAPCRRPP